MFGLADQSCHPGLLLDKWHEPWLERPEPPSQSAPESRKKEYRRAKRAFDEFARTQLARVTAACGDPLLLEQLRNRLRQALAARASLCWRCRTSGPLTLHLSRAGSFENAGIALHPLYGFAYLPGSGIKGMARFYARNLARADQKEMEAVFGRDSIKEREGAAGYVIFYDAWPAAWPRLLVDIVNNHHRKYYEEAAVPEDWEQPNPVHFLAVAPGAEFEFCLGLREPRPADGQRLLELARSWIEGALEWLGAGAKTNAGYGKFSTRVTLPKQAQRETLEATLTLVSPGFFAGAAQAEMDCDLRPASLRGLLRWWWRTLHAGYLDAKALHELEGKLWGLASREGAISLKLEPAGNIRRRQFRRSRNAAPGGRYYLAYGMEGNGKPARYYAEPGARWKVALTARAVGDWNAKTVLDQAVCALWLLSHHGGIGAKCRRGFGSFDVDAPDLPGNIDSCLNRAAAVRNGSLWSESRLHSPSVGSPQAYRCLEIQLPIKPNDIWIALDRLGEAYRGFTASEKRKAKKAYLGLPRMVGRRKVDQRRLPHPNNTTDKQHERHASPLHFRILRKRDAFKVRITALYSPSLPGLAESKAYLDQCVDHIEKALTGGT